MSAIAYYLLLPLLLLISLLPFRLLHLLSDLLFPVIYYLVAYRKKVVLSNLRNSFPEKPEEEIHTISRRFYRHFTDVILEVLKMRTISPAALRQRIRYSNPELLREYYNRNLSIIGMTAHFNSWEWISACAGWIPHHSVVTYKPLNNRYFDRFMKKCRERHGVKLITMRETLRQVVRDQQEDNLVHYGLVSDQSPVWEEVQYWTTMLNQLTPMFTGAEKIAVKTRSPVVYYSMRKIERSRYIIDLIPLSEDHEGLSENEITERFVRTLEEKIRENPEFWLWTHRRWKLTPRKQAEMEKG
jgi:KDO2-lipid IV(A) lauroyltransferase